MDDYVYQKWKNKKRNRNNEQVDSRRGISFVVGNGHVVIVIVVVVAAVFDILSIRSKSK